MLQGRQPVYAIRRLAPAAVTLVVAGCTTMGPRPIEVTRQEWSQYGLIGRRITTEHFDIISTLRDAEFEAALPAFLESVYDRCEATLPPPPGARPRLTMHIFATRPEWTRFTRHRFPARYPVYSKIRAGGFTEGTTSVSLYASRWSALATLAHESWHQYVGSCFDTPIPAWLNEGLACYLEAVQHAGSRPEFTPQHNTVRINSLCAALQRDGLMTLPELIGTDAGEVISQDDNRITQTYYAQVWALVTFLRHGAGGRYSAAFDKLLHDIADGTFSVHVGATRLSAADAPDMCLGEAVFRAYFGCAPQTLSDDYYDHLVRICGW